MFGGGVFPPPTHPRALEVPLRAAEWGLRVLVSHGISPNLEGGGSAAWV